MKLNRVWLALLFLLLCPAAAEAHSNLQLGAFRGGLLHPFQVPAHVLIMAALGLRLGQCPPFRVRNFLAIFAPVAAAALAMTLLFNIQMMPQWLLILFALGVGALISSGLATPPWVSPVLLVIGAAGIGLDSGQGPAPALDIAKALFATWVCLLVVIGYIAFYVALLPPRKWLQTGVRILGSWIVAISFLVLAFYLKKG